MTKELERSLTEIFKSVADAIDGNDNLPQYLRDSYNQEFEKECVREFYAQLIKERHDELFGE